jgi:hypothetical protein
MVYEGPPQKQLNPKDASVKWPPGWIERVYSRLSGQTKDRFDSYWFPPTSSPSVVHKLRSIVECQRYIKVLEETQDEAQAWDRRTRK